MMMAAELMTVVLPVPGIPDRRQVEFFISQAAKKASNSAGSSKPKTSERLLMASWTRLSLSRPSWTVVLRRLSRMSGSIWRSMMLATVALDPGTGR